MPVGFTPKKSGAHRLACRVLYKSLLTTCSRFESIDNPKSFLSSHLKSLVRYRFHHDRDIQSPRQIQDALLFGRKSLHLLDAASGGSTEALSTLTATLSAVQKRTTAPENTKKHTSNDNIAPSVEVPEGKEDIQQSIQSITTSSNVSNPDAIPILERPVPLSRIKGGKRYVPHYIVAQGIPYLKYGRPQPYGVTLYIRSETKRKEKRWTHKEEMERMAQMGAFEDKWDKEMREEFGVADEDHTVGPEGSWRTVFKQAEDEVLRRLREKDKAHLAKGKQMYKIVVEEERLAKEEKDAETREKRRLKRLAAEKDEQVISDSFLGE